MYPLPSGPGGNHGLTNNNINRPRQCAEVVSQGEGMEQTMSFPPKGTVGRPREERAVEGAVLAYRAVVECSAEGKLPNVRTICAHAGVSATDRDPRRHVYFFHLGRTLCVEAGLLKVTARGRSQVYSVVGQPLTDVEVAAAVSGLITPERVALPATFQMKGGNMIKRSCSGDTEFRWGSEHSRGQIGADAGRSGSPASLPGEAASPRGAL